MHPAGRTCLVVLGWALACAPQHLDAHEFSASYSRLTVDDSLLRIEFTLNLQDFHQLQPPDTNGDGAISDTELQSSLPIILRAVQDNFQIEAPENPGGPSVERYERDGPSVIRLHLLYSFPHSLTDLKITSTMGRVTQPDHYHMLQIGVQDSTRQFVLDVNRPSLELDLDGPTTFQSFREFLVLGVEHIVTGYDHLAFLLGLLLTTVTLKNLIKVVTAFTVAHSVTLGLATFGILQLPPRLIESMIALSIAYIAIENFMGRMLVHRWKVTFLFGLVHGFGFSNILREMELTRGVMAISLFSFNLGVELGQLLFVCIAFPAIYYLAASRWKEQVLSGSSLAIMAMGFYWFVQRAFLG